MAFCQYITRSVAPLVVRRQERRPAEYKERARQLMEVLFNNEGEEGSYMETVRKDGTRVTKPWVKHVQRYLDTIDLGPPADHAVHWCFVEEGSYEDASLGLPVGGPCCVSENPDAEAVGKVTVPVLNFLSALSWEEANVERWTCILKLLKRFTLG